MKAEIIAVGYEVLSGKQCNTNAQYLSQKLLECSVEVTGHTVVGDNENSIKKAVAEALSRSNIVILTGGLGPTRDDITKDAVCSLVGIDLELDEESYKKIVEFFKNRGVEMTENNARQAMLPHGCIVVKNDAGLSPGAILKSGNQCIIMLPGPPHELKPMFENSVMPFIKKLSGKHSVLKTVNVFGMGESLIASALDDMIVNDNPRIATYADAGKIDVCVSMTGDDEKTVQRDVDATVDEIKRRLGDAVYGVDTASLAQSVVAKLVSRKLTVATAESCTGGLISKKITDIAGSSLCFSLGEVSYSEKMKNEVLGVSLNTLKENGAVSAETACQMAVGVKNRAESDFGIGITGYAGPAASPLEPVGLVFISVCNNDTVWVKRFELAPRGNETREKIRETASLHAFDMLRRVLDGAAIFNCQRIPISEIENSEENKEASIGQLLYKNSEENYALQAQDYDDVQDKEQEQSAFIKKIKKIAYYLLPNRKDSNGEKVRKSVFLVSSVALIVSVCYILSFYFGIQQNKNLYNSLANLKTEIPSESIEYPDGYLEEFALLYQKNSDIAGWIEIGGTKINYPVVLGSDNDYYLNHNFMRKKDRHGVPFMDFRNSVSKLDFNTIIHGHNMKSDDQMFSDLEKYYKGDQAITFYRNNPVISFDSVYEEMDFKIFAVFTCSVNEQDEKFFDYYEMINPASNEEFEEFLGKVRAKSIYSIPVDVQPTDNILTLSTCYYEYDDQRLVIMARKVRDGESIVVDVNSASHNNGEVYNETTSSGEDTSIIIPQTSRPAYTNSTSTNPSSTSSGTSSPKPSQSSSSNSSSGKTSSESSSKQQVSSEQESELSTSSDVGTSSEETSTSSEETSTSTSSEMETPTQPEDQNPETSTEETSTSSQAE